MSNFHAITRRTKVHSHFCKLKDEVCIKCKCIASKPRNTRNTQKPKKGLLSIFVYFVWFVVLLFSAESHCKGMLYAGYRMPDAGYWLLDAGCRMLDAGCWMLDAGSWMLDVGIWFLVTCHYSLGTGSFCHLTKVIQSFRL